MKLKKLLLLALITAIPVAVWAGQYGRIYDTKVETFENFPTAATQNAYGAILTSASISLTDDTYSGFADGVTQPVYPSKMVVLFHDHDDSTADLEGCVEITGLNAQGATIAEKVCVETGDYSADIHSAFYAQTHLYQRHGMEVTATTNTAFARVTRVDSDSTLEGNIQANFDYFAMGTTTAVGLSNPVFTKTDIYKILYRANAATWAEVQTTFDGEYLEKELRGQGSILHLSPAPDNLKDWKVYYRNRKIKP
jgi:hypothetical protein